MEKKIFTLVNDLEIPQMCFGTNITLSPIVGADGISQSLKAALRYGGEVIRRTTPADWGKKATIKGTKTLTPLVKIASEHGICAFDCSRAYGGSERRLANGLRGTNNFIITKIDDGSQFLGRVEECFQTSLRNLKTDHVDLLLLHWPIDYPPFPDERFASKSIPVYARSWKVLEKIYKSGKAKAIGVSNFTIKQLEELKKYAEISPMANEFECHPLCIRKDLNHYCAKNDIQVLAYASLCGMDKRLQTGELLKIAKRVDKSVAQVILRWHTQRGRVAIFGTTKKERLKCYLNIFDFELTSEELDIVDSYNANYRAFPDSEKCDFTKGVWFGWEDYKDCCP